jgi:hypothetical protein
MNTTPELGFEYFPSPESNDDAEVIWHLFLYCSIAVREWPRFRRELEASGKSPEQCKHLETHAIAVFREMRDTIFAAIETGDMTPLSEPRLGARFAHANAVLALVADPGNLPVYRRMLCPEIDSLPGSRRPDQGDFNQAVWEGKWNAPQSLTPAAVTRAEALRKRQLHEMDGRYNTAGRLDHVATARKLRDTHPATERATPLSEPQIAAFRRKLRALGLRAGLKKVQAEFLVDMAFEKKQQKDNPTAWHAIRVRKSTPLQKAAKELLVSPRVPPKILSCPE